MDRLIIIALSFLLVSCYDSFNNATPNDVSSPTPNSKISELHTLYEHGMRQISQDIVVSGTVTANDEYGNFFKSFIIENDGYAIEILDGLFDSYVRYPLGGEITLKLKGLGVDRHLGVLRTGLVAPATTYFALDYMGAECVANQYIHLTGIATEPKAQRHPLCDLNESHAGEFIFVEGLQLHTEDGVERTWSGYSQFQDDQLNSIWCYTSPCSDFAKEIIPQGRVSLQGILEFGDTDSQTDQFILKLRNAQDCIY